ncbi:MAG: lysine--tRNA ligase [Planctomycetes bacterium]|nr:lysine--tRNA ligase [Planctomycetota bacterium]
MSDDEIRRIKLEKIQELRDMGRNPYPERFERSHHLAEACELEEGVAGVRIAGRMISRKEFGKFAFFTLQDIHGQCQASIQVDRVSKETFKEFTRLADIGDFIGVEGETYRTKVGTLTVNIDRYEILGKTLYPLPEKYHGLVDQEARYRRRYLDLVMDGEARERFLLRGRIVRSIRRILDENGFDEVETPVLQTKPSGALATPFETHHNALDMPLYMRIAPETYLKRCIVAGFDRVYEMARVFRNEGMDPSHLQDFTMLEYYCAYWNFVDNMDFTEKLIRECLQEVLGTLQVTIGEDTIDFGAKWPRRSLAELIEEHSGLRIDEHPDASSLRVALRDRHIVVDKLDELGRGAIIDQLYKKVCRPKLVQPIFVTSHPVDLSPLARRNDHDPTITDRFQLVVRGWEILNAYSELVDPIDQRQRLEEQAALNEGGDDEAMVMDEDYLLAMEHGMPPISGWGMGIDRFAALAAGVENLRDVVLFPLMKSEE